MFQAKERSPFEVVFDGSSKPDENVPQNGPTKSEPTRPSFLSTSASFGNAEIDQSRLSTNLQSEPFSANEQWGWNYRAHIQCQWKRSIINTSLISTFNVGTLSIGTFLIGTSLIDTSLISTFNVGTFSIGTSLNALQPIAPAATCRTCSHLSPLNVSPIALKQPPVAPAATKITTSTFSTSTFHYKWQILISNFY
jgi:hypothetical protein